MEYVERCSRSAANYAVENWHYSHRMPVGKLVTYGVWDDRRFVGAIVFGRGGNPKLGMPYGLTQTECCELVRVALTKHDRFVSSLVSDALHMLKRDNPGLRLVVSFADTAQGHKGGIYQAGNWIYCGVAYSAKDGYAMVNGQLMHGRSIVAKYGTRSISWLRQNVDTEAAYVEQPIKHRYLMPLDKAIRRKVLKLSQRYPT